MNRHLLTGTVVDPPRSDNRGGDRQRFRFTVKPGECLGGPLPVFAYPGITIGDTKCLRQGSLVSIEIVPQAPVRQVNGMGVVVVELVATRIESLEFARQWIGRDKSRTEIADGGKT